MQSLEDRMKLYEGVYEGIVTPRSPIIVRVDGSNFSSYTQFLADKPFNRQFMGLMEKTAHSLCCNVSCVKFAYVASDEISLLIHPYRKHGSQPPYGGRIQKIVSLTAGIASATFTQHSHILNEDWQTVTDRSELNETAFFDSRVFVLPESDVANYFIWRQKSYMRNAVSGLAQQHFSSNALHRKNTTDMLEMLRGKGINWDDLTPSQRLGRVIFHRNGGGFMTNYNCGLFTENRSMIEDHLKVESEECTSLQTMV